jgi:hypothetical protein
VCALPRKQPLHVASTSCRAVQYALGKGVDVIVAVGNESQDLDDPKFDSTSPNNVSSASIIRNRPVDLVRSG